MSRFTIILFVGLTLIFPVKSANAFRVEPSIVISSSPHVVTYGSTSFYFYSNGLMVPTNYYYNTRTLKQMARYSHSRGYRHVYLLAPSHQYGLPTRYFNIAQREFGRYGITYSLYYPNQYYYQHSYDRYPYGYYDRHNHHRKKGYGYDKGGFYFNIRF